MLPFTSPRGLDLRVRNLAMNRASAVSTFMTLGLTRREADVLLWIARGKSNAEIGGSLCISPRTVKKHLEHIFRKLGVKTRLAAAVRAGKVRATQSPAQSRRKAVLAQKHDADSARAAL